MRALFHRSFAKSWKKKSLRVQTQFKKRLKIFLEDPYYPLLENHPLQGEWAEFRSINVTGDYRAIFHYVADNVAEFVLIDTHAHLYE